MGEWLLMHSTISQRNSYRKHLASCAKYALCFCCVCVSKYVFKNQVCSIKCTSHLEWI